MIKYFKEKRKMKTEERIKIMMEKYNKLLEIIDKEEFTGSPKLSEISNSLEALNKSFYKKEINNEEFLQRAELIYNRFIK